MKKLLAILALLGCMSLTGASYAQLTTTTMKLMRGTSLINFTPAGGGVTATYTWPAAPSATRPMQSTSGGALTFAPINLADALGNQVTGTLRIANGGTNSSAALVNGRIMISSGGAIVENVAGTANDILHGDLSWGAIDLATAQVTGTLPVGNGGTGAATLAQDEVLLGNGTGAIASVAIGNDKVLVGNTGAAPTARGIIGGNGINVSVDASNITITNTLAGSSSATGQAAYTADGTQVVTITPGIAVAATSRIILTVTDNVGGNLIAAGVTALDAGAGTFTVSVSTDVDCRINWQITNP